MRRPQASARRWWERSTPAIDAVLLALSAILAAVLWATQLPGHRELGNWLYPVGWKPLDAHPVVFALAVLVPCAAWAAMRAVSARRHVLALMLLVVTSLGAQYASLLLLGPNLETAIERMDGGHGEFLASAHARRGSMLEAIRDYPELLERRELGIYAPSKPPGTLAWYGVIDAASDNDVLRILGAPVRRLAMARPRLARLADPLAAASFLFPLTTALVVLPLVLLGLALTGRARAGFEGALVWLSCPAVLVITHHTDGSLYALLATSAAALAALGARRDALLPSLAGGVCAALGIWCSFGLLPVIGLAVGAQLVVALDVDRLHGWRAIARRTVVHGLSFAVGLGATLAGLVTSGLFRAPLESYERAMQYHWGWKLGFVGGRWGLTGGIEFWLWVGLPLFAVFLVALVRGLGDLRRSAHRHLGLAALGVLAVHLVVMIYAGSNEAARLWLFQVPMIAILAGIELRRASPRASPRLLLAILVSAQLALVPLMRAMQAW